MARVGATSCRARPTWREGGRENPILPDQDDLGLELLDQLRAEVLIEFGLAPIDSKKFESRFLDAVDRYSAWHKDRNQKTL